MQWNSEIYRRRKKRYCHDQAEEQGWATAYRKKKEHVGRPKIEIDWEELKKLCQIQCTLEEIAYWFKCSVDTIENRCKEENGIHFSEYFKKHSAAGRISSRRNLFLLSQKNAACAIFLAKNLLGMRDLPEGSITNPSEAARQMRELARAMKERTNGNISNGTAPAVDTAKAASGG